MKVSRREKTPPKMIGDLRSARLDSQASENRATIKIEMSHHSFTAYFRNQWQSLVEK